MIEQEAPRRLLPAIIAMAIVIVLLWLFLIVLHP